MPTKINVSLVLTTVYAPLSKDAYKQNLPQGSPAFYFSYPLYILLPVIF